jgi:hypothetical protein
MSAAGLSAAALAAQREADAPASIPETDAPGRPAVMIDEGLASKRIRLLSLDDKQVEFIDELQRKRRLPRTAVLALIADPSEPAKEERRAWSRTPLTPPGVLETVDGQRFPGDTAGAPPDAESFAWDIPALGRFELPLDLVRFVRRKDSVEPAPVAGRAPAADTIVLTNGDRLTGFLAGVGATVRFEPTGADPVEIGLDRVAAMILANPAKPARGPRVWLEGGAVAAVRRLTIDTEGRMLLSLEAGPTGSFEWSKLRALSFDAARLVPLSSMAIAQQEPTGDRRWAPPLQVASGAAEDGALEERPLDAADLVLPGPMRVRWDLPEGAARLSATLALAPGSEPWGDCEVIIKSGTREIARRRLIGGNDAVTINVELSSGPLTIEVDAGRYGPIKDRVVIGRPLIMIGRASE